MVIVPQKVVVNVRVEVLSRISSHLSALLARHVPHERGAIDGLLVESGVDVVEQAVADVVGVAGGFCNGLPEVELLSDGGVAVVVAGEGIEGWEDG